MQNLDIALNWLGIDQYYERFVQAGFDSWETLLEITEDDLEDLEVDLGHRRRLQKEIHNTNLSSAQQQHQGQYKQPVQIYPPFPTYPVTPTKRGYRHHPKPDLSAPERPYSAYVLFSNHIRTLLSTEHLDFPEISRQAGQRWQTLGAAEKGKWMCRAQGPWEKYKREVARYQGTEQYAKHMGYLARFKAIQASQMGKCGRAANQTRTNHEPLSATTGASANPTPKQTPAGTRMGFGNRYEPLTSMAAPTLDTRPRRMSSSPEAKLPIQRLRRNVVQEVAKDSERRPGRKQACEPCRQKKTKCDEGRPISAHCSELDIECYYSIVQRDQRKRRFQEVFEKLDIYQKLLMEVQPQASSEQQSQIQQALNLPPHTNKKRPSAEAALNIDGGYRSFDDGYSPNDHLFDVGLMEATFHVNDDNFAKGGTETGPRASTGQSSDVQWVQSLKRELNHGGARFHQNQQSFSSMAQSIIFSEDCESALVGNNVDMFELPIKTTADALVNGYFSTIHVSFPVLNRSSFMKQYNSLATIWFKPADFEDRMFITTLQLLFAIEAVHARLSGLVEVSDDRDHLLYFARARMLAVESGAFNGQVHLSQAQVFGLGAMYCIVTDQTNRAWIASGLAIRSAQFLGLHLQEIQPSASIAEKEYRSYIWFALLSFERTLSEMTGRPSMVQDLEGNLSLFQSGTGSSSSNITQTEDFTAILSTKDLNTRQAKTPRVSDSDRGTRSYSSAASPAQSGASIEAAYFKNQVELTALAQGAVSQLHGPVIRQQPWSKVQSLIDTFDDRLMAWKAKLEPPFCGGSSDFSLGRTQPSFNIALAIQFHCIRAIINRPCLYRSDCTTSKLLSCTTVSRCFSSARTVIELIVDSPAGALLDQNPKWWLLLHHLKLAFTLLLLELAFRTEHIPSETGELISLAKRAIGWLRGIASTSKTAEHMWVTMSCLLVKATRRVGVDASDIGCSDTDLEAFEGGTQHPTGHTAILRQTSVPAKNFQQPQSKTYLPFAQSLDPTAFIDFEPDTNILLPSNREQTTNHDDMEPGVIDELSFEPMATDQDGVNYTDMPAFQASYDSTTIDGQMQLRHTLLAVSQQQQTLLHDSSYGRDPQLRGHNHQHRNGVSAGGYRMDDSFGFDRD